MYVCISKDGVTKIIDAVAVSGIVAIGVGQISFQSLIPSRRIRQAYFDLKPEFVEIVIIVRGRDGKRDGLDAHQGGLKHHVPRRFVLAIHLGHIKQIERHDAHCPRCLTTSPFYSLSGHCPRHCSGFTRAVIHEGCMRMRVDLPKIVPPFILRRLRCFKCFRIMGSNRREDVCIKG